MPRVARIVLPGVAHHVTQRGNNRQDVFFVDDDRIVYLKILAEQCRRSGPEGYAPSDFRRVALDQQKLNSILEKVGLASDEKR